MTSRCWCEPMAPYIWAPVTRSSRKGASPIGCISMPRSERVGGPVSAHPGGISAAGCAPLGCVSGVGQSASGMHLRWQTRHRAGACQAPPRNQCCQPGHLSALLGGVPGLSYGISCSPSQWGRLMVCRRSSLHHTVYKFTGYTVQCF